MKKLRIGILGCNYMGSTHATCYSLLDDADVVAVADLNEEVAKSVADKLGAKVYTDAAKLIEECELDALDICLPTFLHARFALQAMEKGIPYLFIEKPVALNNEECKQLLDAQKKSGTQIQIGQVLRFYDEYVYLKKLIDEKTYGEVVNATFKRLSPSPTWSSNNWVRNTKLSGGAVVDLHIHDIDFMLYVFGQPKKYDFVKNSRGEENSYVMTVCDYGDFAVTVEATWNLPPSYPFNGYYRVVFENAVIELERGKLTLYDADGAREVKPYTEIQVKTEFAAGNLSDITGHLRELKYFTDCMKADAPIEKATLPEAVRSLEFVLNEI